MDTLSDKRSSKKELFDSRSIRVANIFPEKQTSSCHLWFSADKLISSSGSADSGNRRLNAGQLTAAP